MNHVRRAAYLNSNGASYLAMGDTEKAHKSFKDSLKTILQAISEGDVIEELPLPERNPTFDAMARPIPRSRMDGNDAQLSMQADKEGKAYSYGKGLVFYPNTTFTTTDLAFYSSIVVFNLVLTCQRRPKHLQEKQMQRLLRLYQVVLQLIDETSRSGKYDCSHLVVATLNNTAVLHSELGQHASARRMLYHVWDVLRGPQRRPMILDTFEVEGLFLNIFLMLANAPRVAEAA